VLPSGMFSAHRTHFLAALALSLASAAVLAQAPTAAPQPSMRDRIMGRILGTGSKRVDSCAVGDHGQAARRGHCRPLRAG
jgi:hypothetical protein